MWLVFILIGILSGLGIMHLYNLLKSQKICLNWYHWLVGIIWYLAGLFVIGFIGTSFAEGEPRAAGMALLIFGGIFLIVSILLYRFVYAKTLSPADHKKETIAV